MGINLLYCARPQPDGTQGVAEVTFKDASHTDLKKLFGCVVHLPLSDNSLRNLVGCTAKELNEVKYFVLIPWFDDIRPEGTPVTIGVSFHRYRHESRPKTFTVPYDRAIVYQGENRSFFVLPCDSDENQFPKNKDVKSFKSSSFLRKKSSLLLKCENLDEILYKVGTSNSTAFKLTGLKIKSRPAQYQKFNVERTAGHSSVHVTVSEFDKLKECGVLLIQQDEEPSKVVGFYKKEVSLKQLKICTLWPNSEIAIAVEQASSATTSTTATTTITTATTASILSETTPTTNTTTTTATAASILSGTTPTSATVADGFFIKSQDSSEITLAMGRSEIAQDLTNATTANDTSCSSSSLTTDSYPKTVSIESCGNSKVKIAIGSSTIRSLALTAGSQSHGTTSTSPVAASAADKASNNLITISTPSAKSLPFEENAYDSSRVHPMEELCHTVAVHKTNSAAKVRSKKVVHQNSPDVPDLCGQLLKDLSPESKHHISVKISKRSTPIKGWKEIGFFLGVTEDKLDEIETRCSYGDKLPGEYLLEVLETSRPRLTVKEFIEALESFERNDLILYIYEKCQKKGDQAQVKKENSSQQQVHDQIKEDNFQENMSKVSVSDQESSHQSSSSPLPIDLTIGSSSVVVDSPTVNFLGIDVTEQDVCTLEPQVMTNDIVVTILIKWEIPRIYPVISSLFYSVLCGDQEFRGQVSSSSTRLETAQQYFKPDFLKEKYIFIPINRSLHWLLVVITPWHLLFMDSLTWDIKTRQTEADHIRNFTEPMYQQLHQSQAEHCLPQSILKVPQQEVESNNCGIYMCMFIENFLKELHIYERDPAEYIATSHVSWFTPNDAESRRTRLRNHLKSLFQHG